MWFPTGMAVFDFTVKITRFGTPERAHPLVCVIAEALDRLGADHLLADLHREGVTALRGIYTTDPIVITGATSELGALFDRVRAAARELLPDAEVTIDWREHDPAVAAVAAVNREIERVARVFRGLARGAVPQRVRLAVLDTPAYLARYGHLHQADELRSPAELTLNALYRALSDVGAVVGIDWKSNRAVAVEAFNNLRVLPAAAPRAAHPDYTGFVDRWVAADEAELAAADPGYAGEGGEPHTDLFDAVREVLSAVPAGTGAHVPVRIDGELAPGCLPGDFGETVDWLGELVTASVPGRPPVARFPGRYEA